MFGTGILFILFYFGGRYEEGNGRMGNGNHDHGVHLGLGRFFRL